MKFYPIIIFLSIVTLQFEAKGQLDLSRLEKQYGKGEITISKEIVISFYYDDSSNKFLGKASYKIQKIKKNKGSYSGLTQIPFNTFQDLKLKNARYFKFDSIGNKKMVENVKVKYADVKDYFIDGIFYNDLKVKQFRSSVDLPETYLINYSYDIIYHDLKFLNSFYFQDDNEPVDKAKITIRKNPNVKFTIYDLNFSPTVSKSEDEDKIVFKASNLKKPNIKWNTVNRNFFLPHIIVSVNSYQTPVGNEIDILTSTQSLYNWYQELISGLSPINFDLMKKLTMSLVSEEMSDEEKIETIFRWTQANIQYIAFENGLAGFKPEEAEKVLSSKYGDCKGMANLLVNLLNVEGFDARHAWIGTRSNNYSYSIPSLVVDNHMICALKLNNKLFYLDATSKSASWYVSPPHLMGKEVLIANGSSSYLLDTIRIPPAEESRISISGKIKVKDLEPKIDLQINLEGYFKSEFHSYYQYSSNKKKKNLFLNYIDKYLDGIDIDTLKEINIDRDEVSFAISGSFSNYTSIGSNKTLYPFLDINEYNYSDNNTPPTYIKFPFQIHVDLAIDKESFIPKEDVTLTKEFYEEHFSCQYKIENNGTQLKVNQIFTMNSLYIFPKQYTDWNNFLDFNSIYQNYSINYETNK